MNSISIFRHNNYVAFKRFMNSTRASSGTTTTAARATTTYEAFRMFMRFMNSSSIFKHNNINNNYVGVQKTKFILTGTHFRRVQRYEVHEQSEHVQAQQQQQHEQQLQLCRRSKTEIHFNLNKFPSIDDALRCSSVVDVICEKNFRQKFIKISGTIIAALDKVLSNAATTF